MSLHTFDEFMAHPWVQSLLDNYNQKDYNLAFYAIECILRDIQLINEEFEDQHGRSLILSASGRVKSENSTFKKLYDSCCSREKSKTLTRRQLKAFYGEIFDLAGVRFACPYYDQVIPAIECSIRSGLSERGYAVDLSAKPKMNDRNYLDAGDSHGYRAYHFFVKVPTPVDIYGEVEECLVEVQARTVRLQQASALHIRTRYRHLRIR